MGDIIQQLTQRLATLEPIKLMIQDESQHHIGHSGAQGGRHIHLQIVSQHFDGLSQLKRHRLVYQAVGELIPHPIHALAIEALTPDESLTPPHKNTPRFAD